MHGVDCYGICGHGHNSSKHALTNLTRPVIITELVPNVTRAGKISGCVDTLLGAASFGNGTLIIVCNSNINRTVTQ